MPCMKQSPKSDVNKYLTLKAKDSAFKAKAKDRTFEGLNRELDI